MNCALFQNKNILIQLKTFLHFNALKRYFFVKFQEQKYCSRNLKTIKQFNE